MKRKLSLFIIENCVVRRIKSQVRLRTCKRHNDALFLIICITIGLAGCNQTGPKNTEKTESESSETTLESEKDNSEDDDDMRIVNLTNRKSERLDISTMTNVKSTFTSSEVIIEYGDGRVENYVIDEGKIYYTIDYIEYYKSYFEMGENPPFNEAHNTQVRVRDIGAGEDTLLYQYQEDYAVSTSQMQCEGGCLKWKEFLKNEGENNWFEVTYYLADGKTEQTPTEAPVYSDVVEAEGSITKDGVTTSYKHGNKWTKITIEKDDNITQIGVKGLVQYAVSNGSICIWEKSVLDMSVYIYDMVNKRFLCLESGASRYETCIYEHWLIVGGEDGWYAYDIPHNTYSKIDVEPRGFIKETEDTVYILTYGEGCQMFRFLET